MTTPTNKSVNWDDIRAAFPFFRERDGEKPLAFLDSAASAQKPQCVIDRIRTLYDHEYANIHRGIYGLSQTATETYEATRQRVAKFIGATSHHEIVFVRGATEGLNLIAQSWGRKNLKAGDEIVLTTLEHHSNIVPWQLIAEEVGAKIIEAPVDNNGVLDTDAFKALVGHKTRVVAALHISNAIGTVNPIQEMSKIAHDAGAIMVVDGCQAAPHVSINVQELGADFYVFSGHKLYGPTGIGVLWGREALLEDMPPWQGGGDMIETVTFAKTTFNALPHKFEAGTPNIAGGIGLLPAIEFVENIGFDTIIAREDMLLKYAEEGLRDFNTIHTIGQQPGKGPILSLVMDGVHAHDIGTILDQMGVAVRTGHHCCQPLMARFGVSATTRVSIGLYTNEEDIDRLLVGLKKTQEIFA